MMKYKLSIFLLAGLVATICGQQVSRAGFVADYGFLNPAGKQAVGFTPKKSGWSILGDTNPNPVYDVTASSLEGKTLLGNGRNVTNDADTNNTIYGLKAVSFVAATGYAWNYFDVQLDSTIVTDNSLVAGLNELRFELFVNATDSMAALSQTLDFPWEANSGENQHYYALANGGNTFSRVDIIYTPTFNSDNTIRDIHHVNVVAASVPEPTSIAMWGLGAVGMMFVRRKRQQMKLAA